LPVWLTKHGQTGLAWLLSLLAPAAHAQSLSPRTYWPAPTGTTVVVAGYQYQTGDVVTDPSLPITGVDSDIHSALLAWQRTLDLLGRTGKLQLELPYSSGTTRGQVEGLPDRRDVDGPGDLAAVLSVNLLGAPAMSPSEFQALRAQPHPILAASLRLVAPTGQYDKDRLINIGTNRWSTRAELGYIRPLSPKWLLEAAAGTWFFSDNDDFLGTTREQKPIYAFNTSMVHRLRPGFWASLDATYYLGGRTTVDGDRNADLQRNARLGVTLSYPFKGRYLLKASFTQGLVTEAGGDFDSFAVSLGVQLK
jgi:hypothetical protein